MFAAPFAAPSAAPSVAPGVWGKGDPFEAAPEATYGSVRWLAPVRRTW